jgi:hypothetical protein
MSVWRARARQRIAELVADLPADATIQQRRKVLRGQGWSRGWAQKVWQQEVRMHLAQHGAVFGPRKGLIRQFQFPDHVHFPFRESGPASSSAAVGDRNALSSAAVGGKNA